MKPVRTPDTQFDYKGPTPDVRGLPCHRVRPGFILSEWDLTKAERIAIACGGRIELGIHTEPIPPVQLHVVERDQDGALSYVDENGPWERISPEELAGRSRERPLFYVLRDAQTELHLSRSWRWTKRLLPERWFRHTKLALANSILAEALTRTQPGWSSG